MEASGRFTGCDLSDVTSLTMPCTKANGLLRPVFSPDAARLSLELVATAYDLELDAWRAAGWRDVSYLVNDALFTGASVNGRGIAGAVGEYLQRLARARMRAGNPISQLRGAIRPREETETCKAIIMLHAAPGGRYVVGIGFMGTGKRIYDWVSNFRVAPENGLHQGFSRLAREFESRCDQILFPQTAKEMQLPSLSLADIFRECRRPGSRFRIWMAGHSQGAAVMQVQAFREIRGGLLRQHLIGYGFASPSVIYENPLCDLSGFPLYHIINADDAVARVGACLHVGRCRVFMPDEEMRSICYAAGWESPAFRELLSMQRGIRNTGDGFIFLLSLLHALNSLQPGESAAVLTGLMGKYLPERLMEALGGRLDSLLRYLIRKIQRVYSLISGEEAPPASQILQLQRQLTLLVSRCGARAFVSAFLMALSLPHKLRGSTDGNGVASYQYIVTERFDELKQRVWCAPVPLSRHVASPRRSHPAHRAGRFARYSAARSRRARR